MKDFFKIDEKEVKKVKNNFLIRLEMKKESNLYIMRKKFYSDKSMINLQETIEEIEDKNESIKNNLTVKITSFEEEITVKKEIKKEISEKNISYQLKKLIKEFINKSDSTDLKEGKYKLMIDNLQSVESDKKSMVFNSTLKDIISLRDFFHSLTKEIIAEQDEEIIFLSEKKDVPSHRVYVFEKLKSKSFNINLNNRSSEEIIQLIRNKLVEGSKNG